MSFIHNPGNQKLPPYMLALQEGELDTTEQGIPPLESGQIRGYEVYRQEDPSSSDGFWDKVGQIARGLGHIAKEALPYLAAATSEFSPSYPSYGVSAPDNLPIYENQSTTRTNSIQRLAKRNVIQRDTARPVVTDALARIQQQNQLPPVMRMNQLAANSRRILNHVANSRGLPDYEQFQQEHGSVSTSQPDNARSGIEQYFEAQASQRPRGFIQEDHRQIAENLSHAQTPLTPADQLRLQQAELFAHQKEEARQAAIWAQQQQQWAKHKASELRQQTQSQAKEEKLLQAQVTKSRQDILLKQAFYDPSNPKQNILEQANGQARLSETKLNQVELNLDNLLAQGAINPSEYQELAVAAKAAAAQNWLRQDGKDNGNGTTTYRGVTMNQKVAPLVAYADAKRYWDKEVHLTSQELTKAAVDIGKGVYDFFIGDDLKILTDPNATTLAKVLAGGSLVLTFGGGFVEKAGLKILSTGAVQLFKGTKFLTRVTGSSPELSRTLNKVWKLNKNQVASYEKYVKEVAQELETEIYQLPNNGKAFTTKIPSKDPNHGGFIIWEKYIDASGKNIFMGKRSYLRDGSFDHWHQKWPPTLKGSKYNYSENVYWENLQKGLSQGLNIKRN
jgi:hypothetical protein